MHFRGDLIDRLPRARLRDDTSLPSERAELRAAVVAAIEDGFAASLKVDAAGAVYGYARTDRIADIDVDARWAPTTRRGSTVSASAMPSSARTAAASPSSSPGRWMTLDPPEFAI